VTTRGHVVVKRKGWKNLDPTEMTYDDACVVWGHSPIDIESQSEQLKGRSLCLNLNMNTLDWWTTFQWRVIVSNRLPGPGFIIPCPVSEPDNCFALLYFVINACTSHVIITLIRYFQSRNPGIWSLIIPGFRDWKTVRDPGIRDPGIAIRSRPSTACVCRSFHDASCLLRR